MANTFALTGADRPRAAAPETPADGETFTFSYESITYNGAAAKNLTIFYGEILPGSDNWNIDGNLFEMTLVTGPNSEEYGFFNGIFRNWLDNESRAILSVDKHWYEMYTGQGRFQRARGDIAWVKAVNYDFDEPGRGWDPSGLTNLSVRDPVKTTVGDRDQLDWGIQYAVIGADQNPDGTGNWAVNFSYAVNHSFTFFVEKNLAKLKIGVQYSNFSFDPFFSGEANFEHANFTSRWYISPGGVGSVNYYVDGQSITPDSGDLDFNKNSTVKAGELTVSQIEFGQTYTVNGTETRALKTKGYVQGDGDPNTADLLAFGQTFQDLNLTSLETVVMDPEVATPIVDFEDTTTDEDASDNGDEPGGGDIPGFIPGILCLSSLACVLLVINLNHVRRLKGGLKKGG
ncbi:MAG: hypothetical protein ACTSU5_18835 [Promethearchaeota archaeon]